MEKKINKLIKLILYKNIAQDPIVNKAAEILTTYDRKENLQEKAALYYELQRMLLTVEEQCSGSYWQNHICDLVAKSENLFSLSCEKGEINNPFFAMAQREIQMIAELYEFSWKEIDLIFENDCSVFSMQCKSQDGKREAIHEIFRNFSGEKAVKELGLYYDANGCGIYEKYDAFLWNGTLIGTDNYDKMDFDDLIGYELQKNALQENTAFFIQGLKANNILLYGDKGTGKSSCVKSMLTKYKDQKVRMIEMSKDGINDFHQIMEMVRVRGLKFIIFIDDLSFEETETTYKHFKSVVEGGLEKQPDNVLIYVTSNRMHLVKETWDERGGSELHKNDAIQEKLSLADRFGITITFLSPDKVTYMEIVKGIAEKESLDMEEAELLSEANKWEMRYHGRSGRSARQLINYLSSKYGRK